LFSYNIYATDSLQLQLQLMIPVCIAANAIYAADCSKQISSIAFCGIISYIHGAEKLKISN